MKEEYIFTMDQTYQEYLVDESKFQGYAKSISFPTSEEMILKILATMEDQDTAITIQGGKTGITAGAVPEGGHIMNLSRMNQCKGYEIHSDHTASLRVEPGMNLIELRKIISRISSPVPLFWPPDPTEHSATLGGIAASGAGGLTKLLYGDVANYIQQIRMITAHGEICTIEGTELESIIGREGITGIISELTLKLIEKPEEMWGITFFFHSNQDVVEFIRALAEMTPETSTANIAAIEYMDHNSIILIQEKKEFMSNIKELPDIGEDVTDLIYFELHGQEDGIEELAAQLMELAELHNSDGDEAWAVSGEVEIERMHAFRHGAAETANLQIEQARQKDNRITKLGTDMILPSGDFGKSLLQYRQEIAEAGLKSCIFGHIWDVHLHINLLPSTYEEYENGWELLRTWAKRAKECHGTLVGEHGIGKLKKPLFSEFGSQEFLKECRELKDKWDPQGRFNPGNIL